MFHFFITSLLTRSKFKSTSSSNGKGKQEGPAGSRLSWHCPRLHYDSHTKDSSWEYDTTSLTIFWDCNGGSKAVPKNTFDVASNQDEASQDLVVSQSEGTPNRPHRTIVLVMGTPKKVPLVLGKPHFSRGG